MGRLSSSAWRRKAWDCWCHQAAAQVFGKGSDWQAAPRVRTKSSRRSPQLSEQLLQSERKGSAGAPRKMLEGSPTQPPDTWWWSPGHPGPEMGTVCFRVKSETRYSARFGGSYTKTKPRYVSSFRLNTRGSSPANPRLR